MIMGRSDLHTNPTGAHRHIAYRKPVRRAPRMKYLQMLALWLVPAVLCAMTPADILPASRLLSASPEEGPVANAAFHPGANAESAPPFAGNLLIKQSEFQT